MLLGATFAIALALAAAAPAAANSVEPLPPVSPNGADVRDLYRFITIPAIAIFLLVEILLLLIILRFRRSRQPEGYRPPQWSHHTRLEIAWTLGPTAVIGFIGVLSFLTLQNDFHIVGSTIAPNRGASDMEVVVTAYQFGWDYDYPQGFKVSQTGVTPDPFVVPVGRLVRLRLQARDVIHSWWVPQITGKQDAVPGYDNYLWMRVDRAGRYHGQCAELCGAGHYSMHIEVEAMNASDFDGWAAKQQAAAKQQGSPKPSPSASPSPR
jgi:cytochrome c oxidase subunit 2